MPQRLFSEGRGFWDWISLWIAFPPCPGTPSPLPSTCSALACVCICSSVCAHGSNSRQDGPPAVTRSSEKLLSPHAEPGRARASLLSVFLRLRRALLPYLLADGSGGLLYWG